MQADGPCSLAVAPQQLGEPLVICTSYFQSERRLELSGYHTAANIGAVDNYRVDAPGWKLKVEGTPAVGMTLLLRLSRRMRPHCWASSFTTTKWYISSRRRSIRGEYIIDSEDANVYVHLSK